MVAYICGRGDVAFYYYKVELGGRYVTKSTYVPIWRTRNEKMVLLLCMSHVKLTGTAVDHRAHKNYIQSSTGVRKSSFVHMPP